MLILASGSKARQALLKQIGVDHSVIVSEINEEKFSHGSIKKLVEMLAIAKAKNVSPHVLNDEKALGILGCDSLFEFQGQVYGKPKDSKEALMRLSLLSSQSGILHTGHCFIYRNKMDNAFAHKSFSGMVKGVISTKIYFSKFTNDEIKKYVETKESISCAGGFAIDGKGAVFIEKIEGCYSNVIGLSLPWLRNALSKTSISLFN